MTVSAHALTFQKAQRLTQLPPYLFVEIDKAKRKLLAEGTDVIDLGVGDPDLPTAPHIIERLKAAADDPANHRYSFTEGLRELRQAIARWYDRRFGVALDPDTEVLPLLGSKEGLGHLPLALANPGDAVLVPDPCYPPYRSGTIFAGGEVVPMPLEAENQFLPDLGAISQRAARRAKLMFLNYPNNPTAAVATAECFQEAIALANPGDAVLVPDPCYPPYRSGTVFAGADVVAMPLLEENGFFPDLGGISQKAVRRAKLMFLNYPNNPTASVATVEQFQGAIDLAQEYGFVVAHDAAYSEVSFDGYTPPSLLQLPEAKNVGVEFHSLSKTYNMTGWRIGFACGNQAVIAALSQLKSNLDSGIFQPVQWAGIAALEGDQTPLQQAVATYQQRRDLLVEGLGKAGWVVPKPQAGFYLWARVPTKDSSIAFASKVLKQAHVIITPGVGFGPSGEGYVRLSLTVPTERVQEAVARLSNTL